MKKLPTHLRLLRGNPGKRAIKPEPEPTIAPAVPDAPKFLTGYAADEWYRVAEELYRLKLLTVVDVQPLAAYCQSYGIWRTAVETYNAMADRDPATRGLLVRASSGGAVQNPLVLTARQAAKDMVHFAGEFGLTPRARSYLDAAGTPGGSGKFGDLLA